MHPGSMPGAPNRYWRLSRLKPMGRIAFDMSGTFGASDAVSDVPETVPMVSDVFVTAPMVSSMFVTAPMMSSVGGINADGRAR